MPQAKSLFVFLLVGTLAGLGAGRNCMSAWAAQRSLALVAEEKEDKKAEGDKKEDAAEPEFRKATDEERKAATTAIEAQLKAFRDDDYEKAGKYQSAGLRKNVPSAEAFRAMMRRSYPQFAKYKSVSFGDARCSPDGALFQINLVLTGQDGVTVRATYLMVKEEGEYKVATVLGGTPPKIAPKNIT
jgi:F0F1-type ATP synthase assembly protein I